MQDITIRRAFGMSGLEVDKQWVEGESVFTGTAHIGQGWVWAGGGCREPAGWPPVRHQEDQDALLSASRLFPPDARGCHACAPAAPLHRAVLPGESPTFVSRMHATVLGVQGMPDPK